MYVESRVLGYTNKVFHFEHEMWNREKNELAAVMDIKLVIFDLEARKAIPMPKNLKLRLDKLK